MPKGVYKRKPRKVVASNMTRIYIDVPKTTVARLDKLSEKTGKNWSYTVLKAIYDALPVEYEVDSQFIFPFGKYHGETAGMVKEMDSSYLDWAKRTITGFKLVGDLAPVPTVNKGELRFSPFKIKTAHKQYGSQLRQGECIRFSSITGKVWAYNPHLSPAHRFLGYLSDAD